MRDPVPGSGAGRGQFGSGPPRRFWLVEQREQIGFGLLHRKRSINPALSVGGELRDACVHVEQRGHMRCRATQRY